MTTRKQFINRRWLSCFAAFRKRRESKMENKDSDPELGQHDKSTWKKENVSRQRRRTVIQVLQIIHEIFKLLFLFFHAVLFWGMPLFFLWKKYWIFIQEFRPINEASYFDRINMTENELEFDQKIFTPANVNVRMWPKSYNDEHEQLNMTEIPMKMTKNLKCLKFIKTTNLNCRIWPK